MFLQKGTVTGKKEWQGWLVAKDGALAGAAAITPSPSAPEDGVVGFDPIELAESDVRILERQVQVNIFSLPGCLPVLQERGPRVRASVDACGVSRGAPQKERGGVEF